MNRILPPAGPPRVLALAQLVNSLGDGAYYATSALFFTRIVGLSPTQVGLGLTLAWGAGMLAGVPMGHLADRWGPRRTALLLALLTAAALSAFLVVRSFPAFLVAACAYACCQAGLTSARQALLAGLVDPAERTAMRARLQSTLNAGLAVGAGLGGLALSVDTEAAYLAVFVADAVCFLAATLVLRGLPEVPPAPPVAAGEPRLAVLRDRPYALITLLNAVMYLNMPLLSLGLPLWIVHRTEAPAWLAAALLMVYMISVVLFQVRLARPVTGPSTAATAIRRAGLLMFAACAVYALSGAPIGTTAAIAVLLVAAVIQVFGEMMQGAGGWELSFALAPDGRHGQYQGFYGMAPQIARMLGPLLLTTMLLGWGTAGWLTLGVAFLLSGLAITPVVRATARVPAPQVKVPA
ncbi:MFS transporter [Spongiactinospora rosea]|uniref:MFS transporter n=1 Tax=Spongiactinospora rosea TaxID=2248750 RepID=A0A366LMF9_9ACTN|nr:MFS transporter [Spongiactinospora rosea]RBQ14352.1 MFS transporter [Spongiactinospora rosea]